MTLLEVLEHLFFMFLIIGISGALIWLATASENPFVVVLAGLAYLVAHISLQKERRYLMDRLLSEDNEPKE